MHPGPDLVRLGVGDRAYLDDARGRSRYTQGAVLDDQNEIDTPILRLVTNGRITSINGIDILTSVKLPTGAMRCGR